MLLVLVAVSLAGPALVLAMAGAVLAELLGYEAEDALFWVAFSFPLWGPLAVIEALRVMPLSALKEMWASDPIF